jgi:hypothetical protein
MSDYMMTKSFFSLRAKLFLHASIVLFSFTSIAALANAPTPLWSVTINAGVSQHGASLAELGISSGTIRQRAQFLGVAVTRNVTDRFAIEAGWQDYGGAWIVSGTTGKRTIDGYHAGVRFMQPFGDRWRIEGLAARTKTYRAIRDTFAIEPSPLNDWLFTVGASYAIAPRWDVVADIRRQPKSDVNAASVGLRFKF